MDLEIFYFMLKLLILSLTLTSSKENNALSWNTEKQVTICRNNQWKEFTCQTGHWRENNKDISETKSSNQRLILYVTREDPISWARAAQQIMNARKSSCANARGIPTTAYQVLHLLPEVGYPPPAGGTLPQPGGLPPSRGYSPSWTWMGYPPPPIPGRGTPPPVDRQMDGQTRVKTLPSRRTTYAVGNHEYETITNGAI